jgi:hypothetical protein
MKKSIINLFTLALALIITIGGHYPDTGRIVRLDETNDSYTVKTCDGKLFTMYGIEDLSLGDMLSLLFDDKGTPDWIWDDEIVSIRYSGTITDYHMPEDNYIIIDDLPDFTEPMPVLEEELIIEELPELELIEFQLELF